MHGSRKLSHCPRAALCASLLFLAELTNLMKLSDPELKALSYLLKDVDSDAPRADIIKGLQKIVDEYVPPEVRLDMRCCRHASGDQLRSCNV